MRRPPPSPSAPPRRPPRPRPSEEAGRPGSGDRPPAGPPDPTVFVVDDDPDILASISLLLRSVRLPVRTCTGAGEFLAAWQPGEPGCLILDVRIPGMSGLELQALLKERDARIPIVFLSGHGDIPMALRAVRTGALDFLEKPFRDQALIDAVHAALAEDAGRRKAQQERESVLTLVGSLSPREAQVADLVVDGLSSPEIAQKLKLSRRTVEMHRARLMRRLGVESVAELTRVILAARALLPPPASAADSSRRSRRGARG